MRKIKILLIFAFFFLSQSCKQNYHSSSDIDSETSSEEVAYPDGTYSAEVEYYNPSTETRHTYTLNVDVEDNEVTIIHWPNGGWLDDSHFNPEELDSDGSCSFSSDRGYEYEIQITGPETFYTDENNARYDSEDDHDAVTCPECGGEKESYDELCYSCKRKKEDIEEHTCKVCGQYDSFMFSSDDMCSDCKRKKEEEERENNEEDEN